VDLRAGSRLGTEHLIELGHRRIASVFPPENLATTAERLAGHVEALRAAGLEPATPVHSEIALPAAAAAAASLVAGAKFTALFVASDTLAVGVLGELRRRGVRVPEDVSVVGFGGLVDWENRSPALTTVRTFPGKLGAAGVRRALDLLAGKDGPPRVRLHPVELVVRESTRRLPRHAWSLRRPGTPAAP
jgi:DNA-binding LacI/PurR family transcriptional regulator